MRLQPGAIFRSVALVSGASYVVCAAFVALAPGLTSQFFGWMMHINLSSLSRHITWGSFFGGLLCFSVLIGFLAGAAAWAYNRLTRVAA